MLALILQMEVRLLPLRPSNASHIQPAGVAQLVERHVANVEVCGIVPHHPLFAASYWHAKANTARISVGEQCV